MVVSTKPALTEVQEWLLNYLRCYVRTHGYPPSTQEIQVAARWQSTSSVKHQLQQLVTKGWIIKRPGNRTIQIVEDPVTITVHSTTKTTDTGLSKATVIVAGAIDAEVTLLVNDTRVVAFSDGTVLRVGYDTEKFGVTPLHHGTAALSVVPGNPSLDGDNSDTATLTGVIDWVVFGHDLAVPDTTLPVS